MAKDTLELHKFLPSLTGQNALNDETRELMAIPVRRGGLGIINPSHNNQIQHQSSEHITAPLVSLILQQSHTYPQEAKAERRNKLRNSANNGMQQQQLS